MDTSPSQTASRQPEPTVLLFGPFALHRASQQLLKGGETVRIGSRAFCLLVDLVERAGELRTRAQLEARVWPRSVVEETSLRVHMSALRRALGDGRDGARYIANIPGCGYRFVGTVTQARPANVPVSPPPQRQHRLIGRDAELHALCVNSMRTRLLSIVGPGGIGKTALALAGAAQLSGRFADGVLHADLAGAGDLASVVDAVAGAAAIVLHGLPALCGYLGRRRLLLVLDNCDRAVEGVAALAIAVLQQAPGVHMLVTTREPLDVEGERLHWLDGLAMPADDVAGPAAMRYPAVVLFVERARANDATFVLDAANAGAVCRLCRHLDGIPLAIELAAARVEGLGVAGMAAALDGLLGLLTRARRTALPRHRTMEATLAWSFDLLAADERAVLCRSAIFEAEFSIEAAGTVCSCERIDAIAVARCIESLAAKSLLVRCLAGGSALYRQLLLTRTYTLAKLDAAEKALLARRHAGHVAALLQHSVAAAARAPLPWLAAHGRSLDDCRAALDWAFSEHGERALGVAITPALARTMRFLGLPDQVRHRLMHALDERGAPAMAQEAAIAICTALAILGAYSHNGFDLLREVLARLHGLLRTVASPALHIEALMAMATAAFAMGEPGLLLEIVRAVRALARDENMAAWALIADRLESDGTHLLGEHAQSQALCQRILQADPAAIARNLSCPTPMPVGARWNLARIAWIRGQPELAAQIAHEALLHAEQQQGQSLCQTLVVVVLPVAFWRGDHAYAAQLVARLHALADSSGSDYWRDWARAYAAVLGNSSACPAALAPIARDLLATLDAGLLDEATVARADAGTIPWCAPEVWRAQGEALLREDPTAGAAASALFLRALALARRQQALGWELRVARSLAHCWANDTRAAEGRDVLAQVLARFSEGFCTADYLGAAAELARLQAEAP